jgi:FixJ family two-component response regulator
MLISVVDDDESVRESLPDLLRELGFEAEAFASAEEFLESRALSVTGCLVLDVAMPGMSGIALHRELRNRGSEIPVVFITAYSDEATHLSLSLTKPFSDQALLDAVNLALERR